MFEDQVILDPANEVILEDTFDQLVKKVGGKEQPSVGTRNTDCEWLSTPFS
jgi:hypothetical protein